MSKWKYCVTANIKRKHKHLRDLLKPGTWTFPGGRLVYICNRPIKELYTVLVMGLSWFRQGYVFDIVPIEILENVQSNYVFDPSIIELMDSLELQHLWWGDKPEDGEDAERYAERSIRRFWKCRIKQTLGI